MLNGPFLPALRWAAVSLPLPLLSPACNCSTDVAMHTRPFNPCKLEVANG
jgi:hypothetical protein